MTRWGDSKGELRVKYLSELLLIGISVALITIFIYMRLMGSYVAIEDNILIWGLEVAFFTFMFGWGIYSLARKLR